MKFYLCLFNLIYLIDLLFGMKVVNPVYGEECIVTLRNAFEEEECYNGRCHIVKNPLEILRSRSENGKNDCYFHHLCLFFDNNMKFMEFAEKQKQSEQHLQNFFSNDYQNDRVLEVEIMTFIPKTTNDLFDPELLPTLVGKTNRVNVFRLSIAFWNFTFTKHSQHLKPNFIDTQPVDEIMIRYPCGRDRYKADRLIIYLSKHHGPTVATNCPTQIYVEHSNGDNDDVSLVNIDNEDDEIPSIQLNRGNDRAPTLYVNDDDDDDDIIKKKDANDYTRGNNWNLFAKIGISLVVIVLLIICILNQFICRRSQSQNNNN